MTDLEIETVSRVSSNPDEVKGSSVVEEEPDSESTIKSRVSDEIDEHDSIPEQSNTEKSIEINDKNLEAEKDIESNLSLRPPEDDLDSRSIESEQTGTLSKQTTSTSEAPQDLKIWKNISNASNQNSGKLNPQLFVIEAFKHMSKAKATKRHKKLREAINNVQIELQKQPFLLPEVILEPLVMACQTNSTTLLTITLDCFAKLIDYNYFDSPTLNPSDITLMERVVNTIASCFCGESTPERVQLQIVKALLAAITSERTIIRHSFLLTAVRQTYNIFLLCKDSTTQAIAQVALLQMVDSVFQRLSTVLNHEREFSTINMNKSSSNGTPDRANSPIPSQLSENKLTLESFEHRKSFDQVREEAPLEEDSLEQQLLRDAFLLIRALCKLSIKNIPYEHEYDLKSQSMRSKLMSLHLIYHILRTYMNILSDINVKIRSPTSTPTPLIDAVKQYICLALAKNVVSHVLPVFEISCEIFWLILSELKNFFKSELEVFFTEIFFPILEMRTSSNQQKIVLLNIFHRMCEEPQTLIELYLNYDCISGNTENIYERAIVTLSRIASQSTSDPPPSFVFRDDQLVIDKPGFVYHTLNDIPQLNSSTIGSYVHSHNPPYFDYQIRLKSYRCLISTLSSLFTWCNQTFAPTVEITAKDDETESTSKGEEPQKSKSEPPSAGINSTSMDNLESSGQALATDDPSQFENLKHRKKQLQEAIQKFNYKPKEGIKILLSSHFIASKTPTDIAKFLISTEGLDKAVLGEYLGEGNDENIAIMHSFVDHMSFNDIPFVNALRSFLQKFRLPGEAQKIDRFMLKFAEKYIDDNLGVFKNADTAYILAYSIIMLNTDLHSPQVKNRMTCQDFIKNNRGVDDGANLSDSFLTEVYEEIQKNEIVLKDEQDPTSNFPEIPGTSNLSFAANISNALATVGRDLQREAYYMASNKMANKTEALFKDLIREQRERGKLSGNDIYYTARHFEHVCPMFEAVWMPILAAFSEPLQLSSDPALIQLSLDGFRLAMNVIFFFSMDLPRNAFMQTLTKFTHLNNTSELKWTNMHALKTLLEISLAHGDKLRDSWKDVLLCISQLERVQLISAGVDINSLPDVSTTKPLRKSLDKNIRQSRSGSISLKHSKSFQSASTHSTKSSSVEIVREYSSREVVMAVDMLFSNTRNLGSEGIYDFVKALIEVSWEEIECSLELSNPRLFSLQKLVEISYYNMRRIRMEWSSIWSLLGTYFTQVSCHENSIIASFALDSLRQFSMQFLEIEELSHFKFQKDFLQPFSHAMENSQDLKIKDLVLRCIDQMIKARYQNIRSGWRTIFHILAYASKIENLLVLQCAISVVSSLGHEHISCVLTQGAYIDLISCITKFAKLNGNQKFCLSCVDMLKNLEHELIKHLKHMKKESVYSKKLEEEYWLPFLLSFNEIICEASDLEVRSKALKVLFDCLYRHADDFDEEFWETVSNKALLSIFSILSITNSQRLYLAKNTEETEVWMLTTMVEALKAFIELIKNLFERLHFLLPKALNLLEKCICQENSMISKVGLSCFSQFVLKNKNQFKDVDWDEIINSINQLLQMTLPIELRDPSLYPQVNSDSSLEDVKENSFRPHEISRFNSQSVFKSKKHHLKSIVVKCTLQLLMLNCLWELFHSDNMLTNIPKRKMVKLLDILKQSWEFAESFNSDFEIRAKILSSGIVEHMPNLLSQEALCAKLYFYTAFECMSSLKSDSHDTEEYNDLMDVFQKKIYLASQLVLHGFQRVIGDNPVKGVAAFQPVIAALVSYINSLDEIQFSRGKSEFYQLLCAIVACGHIDQQLGTSLSNAFLRYAC
ncbi:ArfGEF [Schizosaccharomyces pombe]|uniref:ADP-ribosylation factor guanine nucleotide-exchange factor sec71 n=1 Tax=Schizosaccharomyces pombe (strain 972 / ATCC 24843) TaxID=284812 RepID=SEC71_SCHPO|nr:putative Sec7 domain-containing protein sec71 [Schizosaccharomyces pombe]Q9UT02.1 RecName: Full=Protein transport protein sec71 [Schizosaccharomyces pombe 972h-]CAB55182.1 Sec7 domain protein, ARF GEF (predicted) [Schizosaccharomyces pombe]|eukprot:NP_594954.1 putative Sec7 domain-containing protein sec71 [Schizosaccharomyces pombe]